MFLAGVHRRELMMSHPRVNYMIHVEPVQSNARLSLNTTMTSQPGNVPFTLSGKHRELAIRPDSNRRPSRILRTMSHLLNDSRQDESLRILNRPQ